MNCCNRVRGGLAAVSLCLLLALLTCFGSLTAFGAPGAGGAAAAPDRVSASAPTPAEDCRNLVITSFYTPGDVAGAGLCEYAFAELYNGGDRAVSLAGLSLYLPGKDGGMTEYPLPADARVPAGGCFLIRGAEARAVTAPVLRLSAWDTVLDFCPDPTGLRVVLAASGTALRADEPLAGQGGVYAYLSAAAVDAQDAFHYVRKTGAGRLLRKRADTDKVAYQSLKLSEASWTVLRQVTPRTTAGRVNGEIAGRLPEVAFSAPGGVYEQGFDLTMTAPAGYTVYYSINGDDPRRAWELGRTPTRYTGAIRLRDTTDMTWGQLTKLCASRMGSSYYPLASSFPGAAVIRAYAVRDADGAVTPMTTQTYFIGSVYREWNMDMVSVSVSAEDFLGDDGIYLCRTAVHEHIPAYVEFLSREGESVFSGWSEIAMNGRGSLGMRQKSFRILLKSDPLGSDGVGENLNTLNYDLFGEYANRTPDGERVTWYRHTLLRNGGGDNSGCTISRSHIGDAYIQRIDRFLKPDDMAYAPVMTFVNGEFWGLFNARDRLDTKYFTGKYGVAEQDFSMLECPYPLTYGWNVDYMAAYGDPAQADEFNALVRFIKTHNMADVSNYLYVSGKIDIDGLIDFFCAQIYLCCSDWPGNNIKVWRNTNPDGGMDTKWHFCIVDTDHGVGLNSTLDTDLFGVINDGSILGAVVNHLMQNNSFRERFILRFVWCTEIYFQPDRLVAELDALIARITPVMQLQLSRWRVTDGSMTTYETWWSYIEVIRNFVTNRPAYARRQLMSWAGLDDAAYGSYKARALRMWGTEAEQTYSFSA